MNSRSVIVALFALIGAWLSAAYMPALLDFIFIRVERANFQSNGAIRNEPIEPKVKPSPNQQEPADGELGEGDGPAGETEATAGSDGSNEEDPVSSEAQTSGGPGSILTQSAEKVRQEGVEPEQSPGYPGSANPGVLAAMALLGAIVGGAFGNVAYSIWRKWVSRWDTMEIGGKVSLFIGVFAGIVASIPFLFAFQGLGGVAAPLLTVALVVGFSALSILALRSMDEVLPWSRNKGVGRRTGIKILDTNVIIDGRIIDLVRTGFLEGDVYVPKFVIDELQHIADSSDALRRQRGRRGLEILRLLQADYELKVGTEDGRINQNGEVDDRLVRLATVLGADLVSNDFNLNKVASLQNVRVLNINDLALSLRPNVLPGEKLNVTIIREGNQQNQGVGYLDDGTMVVVEHGRAHIGEHVSTSVTQVIQTERGKMIFADSPSPLNGGNGR